MKWMMRLRPCARITKQYSNRNVTVGTTKKSQAAVQFMWFLRNDRQVWDGGSRSAADHVLGDRGFRNVVAEKSQLGLDARCTPERILPGHAPDQARGFLGRSSAGHGSWTSSASTALNPRRCQRTTVSGWTTTRAERQPLPQIGDPNPERCGPAGGGAVVWPDATDEQPTAAGAPRFSAIKRGAVGEKHPNNDADDVGRSHSVPRLVTESGILAERPELSHEG